MRGALFAVSALLGGLLAGCGGPVGGGDPADGPTLYLESCASCHGVDARGTDAGPDLRWRTETMTLEEVADTIVLGHGQMLPLDLDDDEAEAVAEYILESLLRVE